MQVCSWKTHQDKKTRGPRTLQRDDNNLIWGGMHKHYWHTTSVDFIHAHIHTLIHINNVHQLKNNIYLWGHLPERRKTTCFMSGETLHMANKSKEKVKILKVWPLPLQTLRRWLSYCKATFTTTILLRLWFLISGPGPECCQWPALRFRCLPLWSFSMFLRWYQWHIW